MFDPVTERASGLGENNHLVGLDDLLNELCVSAVGGDGGELLHADGGQGGDIEWDNFVGRGATQESYWKGKFKIERKKMLFHKSFHHVF